MRETIEITGHKIVVIKDPNVHVRFVVKELEFPHADLELDNTIHCYLDTYDPKLVVRGAINPLSIEPDVSNMVRISLRK